MKVNQDIIVSNILYSCIDQKQRGHEQIVQDHSVGFIASGQVNFETPDGPVIYKEGSLGVVKKNQLVRSLKVPPSAGEFKAINIFLDQDVLRRYSADHDIHATGKYTGQAIRILSDAPVIMGFFQSLLPYFDHPEHFTADLAELKTREAIALLLGYDPAFKDLLFDFSEPHKIDLESFMNKNFTYHIPLNQFARLTGRSLATFKRDFHKIFEQSPEKWLLRKRLEQAHFLIKNKKQTPGNVYLEVGFENLSHFSASFKNFFGYNPSSIIS